MAEEEKLKADSIEKLNDFEKIKNRLSYDLISYMTIEDTLNFPLLHKNDVVALKKTDYYSPADLVLYEVEEFYFLRRIIEIKEDKVYVCGDNEMLVRVIDLNSIIARAISRERGTKRLSLILESRKKLYTKAIVKKGKSRIKNHLQYDDEISLSDAYNQALQATLPRQIETTKTSEQAVPIDARLAKELAVFKSPIQKLREFEHPEEVDSKEDHEEIISEDI